MSICFKSGLAPAIRAMIDYKVSLGYEESTYLTRSHSLDRYCICLLYTSDAADE